MTQTTRTLRFSFGRRYSQYGSSIAAVTTIGIGRLFVVVGGGVATEWSDQNRNVRFHGAIAGVDTGTGTVPYRTVVETGDEF